MGPDTNSMQITSLEGPDEEVLTLSGKIGRAQVPELRARLLEAVDHAGAVVLIDTHQVTAFDDAALVALTAARKRSRFLRHRIVVVDGEHSVVAASLRRNGMHVRMPVFPDVATASRSLAADREARARLTLRELLPERPALESTPRARADAGRPARAS
jgi:anti-anti-sigma regulatory factor